MDFVMHNEVISRSANHSNLIGFGSFTSYLLQISVISKVLQEYIVKELDFM